MILMAFLSSPRTERPDGTSIITGSEGKEVLQDDDKLVSRPGAASTQADYDIIKDSQGTLWDLDSDGDFNIPGDTPANRSANPNVGGTAKMAGGVVSTDDATFDVTIEWRDQNDNLLLSETFSSGTSTDFGTNQAIQFDRLWTKSDRFTLIITDTSGGQNRIRGSLNFHT